VAFVVNETFVLLIPLLHKYFSVVRNKMKTKTLMLNNEIEYHRLVFLSDRKVSNYCDFQLVHSEKLILLDNFVKKLYDLSFESKILSILNYVEFNLLKRIKVPNKIGNNELENLMLKRDVKQIIENGFIGCTDLAIVCQYVLFFLGYKTKILFAVSEHYKSNNDAGHTLLCLIIDDINYIVDCSLKCLTLKSEFDNSLFIPSNDGSLFVFAECFHPKFVDLNSINNLSQYREFFHSKISLI
jgi:hypothetical protein